MSAAPLLYRPDIGPVLIASGGEGATRRYRAYHHAEQLELAGVAARVAPRIDAALAAEAPRWPIVLLHRVAWDGAVQALIDRTRDGGGVVLFDVDDLVFEPESTRWHHGVQVLTPAEQALYHQGVRRYRRTLLACDAAIVPTAALAARVERAGRPALISRNCVDDELLRLSERAAAMAAARSAHGPRGTVLRGDGGGGDGGGDPIVVGYASGTRTHDRDFNAACGPALRRVMGRHPNVRLHLVGPLALDDDWSPLLDRVVRLESVGWRDLPALLAEFDINVAPLEVDNLFCQCKSELKWLEAAACGRPTVASATQAFADALAGARGGEAGERIDGGATPLGLLATTVDEWEAALESLVTDAARREAIGGAAARWVAAERTTHAQAGAFVQMLMAGMESGRSNFGANDEAAQGASPAPSVRRDGGRATAARDDRTSTSEREAVRTGVEPAAPSDAPRLGAAERLTIKVLVPEPPPGSGGHTSIFRMVAALCDAGHDVAVHIDRGPLMQRISEREAERYIRAHFPPSPATIRLGRDLGPADVAIATGWTTAAVAAWAPDVGTRLYFVQDYEPYFQPLSADYVAAAQTYRLGLGHITLGPWLAALIESRFSGRARPIDFGVEHDRYAPPAPRPGTPSARSTALSTPPRIVFYARAITPRRGVALGLAALKRVRAERPDVEIVLYGGEPRPGLADFPHEQAGVLDAPALAALYHGATVGLALSYTNLSFVPLEMMACGLPVVVAHTEPAAWFQHDGVNCAVAEPTADGLATTLLRVIDDGALRAALIDGGRAAVAPLSWERSTRQFVDHVAAYVRADRAATTASAEPTPAPRTGPPPLSVSQRRLGQWTIGDTGGLALAAAARNGDAAADARAMPVRTEAAWRIQADADGLYRIDLRFSRVPARPGDSLAVLRIKPHPTAPLDLASVDVRLDSIVPDAWTPFLFPALTDVVRRPLWAVLSRLDDAAADPTPLVLARAARVAAAGAEVDMDGDADVDADPAPPPAHRVWSLAPPPERAAADPALYERLADRRRAMREPRRAAGRRERHRVASALLARWAASTAPMPPLPLRPWPADAPAGTKFRAGVRHYGLAAVLREAVAALRYRIRARTDRP